ncbi:hypothetical protein DJFAAGMI_01889 [Comamonas sp. PE63]|uniref:Uncharacterized protein n=1 Tax=Comamonas brasiliensis TaxID=1812482 RepID=A0ABS5LRL3_9BURK|nr:hypothetical protein [Comamonas sp. PE63]MBS3019150.1 hypothetical protein [Comamonas sp. PE63]
MSAPIIQLDGAPTPRMLKRNRRAYIRWMAVCAAALTLAALRVAIDAGVL